MKKVFIILTGILWLIISVALNAQTNTFPKTGNVGIGTTSPVSNLHIAKSMSPVTLRLDYLYGPGYNCMVHEIQNNLGRLDFRYGQGIVPEMETYLTLYNGKLGLNVTDPFAHLHVDGNAAIGYSQGSLTVAPVNGLLVKGKTGIGVGVENPTVDLQVSRNAAIGYEGSTNNFNDFGLLVNGKVGINISEGNPVAELQIKDDWTFGTSVESEKLKKNICSNAFWDELSTSFKRTISNIPIGKITFDENGNIIHCVADAGAEGSNISDWRNVMTIYNSSKVGILTNPAVSIEHELEVNGTISANTNIIATGYLQSNTLKPKSGTLVTIDSDLTINGDLNTITNGNVSTKSLSSIDGDLLVTSTMDINGAAKIYDNGNIWAQGLELSVSEPVWPDFVFEDDYNLLKLSDVENFISINKHLPNVPSCKEVLENGINVVEMDALLLKKIEELTLYIIEQQKEIKTLKEEFKEFKTH